MKEWKKKKSPQWLTHLVGVLVGTCFVAVFLDPCMGAACGTLLLVCWVLRYGTTPLSSVVRRRFIIGYASLHVGSWVMMHALVSIPFLDCIRLMHQRAGFSINLEIARYREWEGNLDPKSETHMRNRINTHPRSRVFSICPLPFMLVANEDYQIGPLWGAGMTRIYVFRPAGIKLLFEGKRWIS